jgi:hypothetical protein
MLTEQFEPETPEEEYNQSIINRIFNDGIHPWMVAKELGVDQPAINRVLKAYGYGPPDFWNASRTPEALAERKLRWNSWRALTYRRKFKLWL